jgi:hypothetical protein
MSDKKLSGKPENKAEQRYKPWLRKQGRGGGVVREQAIKKKDPEGLPYSYLWTQQQFCQV